MENHLEALSVQTGFSKEVLMAQIGIKPEDMGQHKPAETRKDYPVRKNRLPETYKTEQTLLALLSMDKLPQGTVKAEDFSHPVFRTIAEEILTGKKPAQIMAEAEQDEVRQAEMSKAMLSLGVPGAAELILETVLSLRK